MTQTAPSPSLVGRGWLALAGAGIALLGLLIGLWLGGSAYAPAADGLPDTGAVVGWGLPVSRLVTTLAATVTLGMLVTAAFLMPGADRDLVSRPGRRDLVLAAGWAMVWALSSLTTLAFTHATVVGQPLLEAMRPEVFFTYALEIPQNVAYLVSAVLALVIATGAALCVRSGSAAMLFGIASIAVVSVPLTAHGTALGDHSLALTAGALHGWAAAVWVGGLVAVTRHALRRDPGFPEAVRRFSVLATAAVVLLALSGIANAYTRLEQPSELFTTPYGLLVLLKVALLAALAVVAFQSRRRVTAGGSVVPWLVSELVLLAVTIGVAVSLTVTAYPRQSVPLASPGEELLGYPFPPPPDASNIILGWYPDAAFLVLAALLAGGYVWGVWRCRSRGVHWPWGRTVSWAIGVLLLVWATSFGISGYAKVSVEWHMLQHMMMSMLIPIMLVLGMPATLALRAFRPAQGTDKGPREWVLWGLHSPVSSFVTHPIYVLLVGTVGLFGLYFTPLFGYAMGSHIGHVLMGLHFLLAGFLFYWVVLGLDPGPRTVPPWARLILLLVFVSLHAFFAVAIMMSTQPLGAEWFGLVQPPWISDTLRDTVDAGGVAWAIGELPALIVMVVVAVQWARSDEREARRRDRRADRAGDTELDAYNERLAALAQRDRAGSGQDTRT